MQVCGYIGVVRGIYQTVWVGERVERFWERVVLTRSPNSRFLDISGEGRSCVNTNVYSKLQFQAESLNIVLFLNWL